MRAKSSLTTGDASFPECQMHSEKGQKHLWNTSLIAGA
jgi:hypothetical protein